MGIPAPVHHPAPARLDPGHAAGAEERRGVEALAGDGLGRDGGAVGLVDGDGVVVVGRADLPVGVGWCGFGRRGRHRVYICVTWVRDAR